MSNIPSDLELLALWRATEISVDAIAHDLGITRRMVLREWRRLRCIGLIEEGAQRHMVQPDHDDERLQAKELSDYYDPLLERLKQVHPERT